MFFGVGRIGNDVLNVADDGRATKAEIVNWLAGELGLAAPRFTGEPAGGRRTVTPDRVISNAKIKAHGSVTALLDVSRRLRQFVVALTQRAFVHCSLTSRSSRHSTLNSPTPWPV